MNSAPDIEVVLTFGWLKVYLGDLLHLAVKFKSIVSVQSWIYEERFVIEFTTTRGQPTFSEYITHEIWQKVLTEIEKKLV